MVINPFLKWILNFLFLVLSLCLVVFVCLVGIDSTGVSGFPTVEGFNRYKPVLPTDRMKIYLAESTQPKTLLAGTSRMAVLNPEPVGKLFGEPFYNIGLNDSSIIEHVMSIQYVLSRAPVEHLIYGIDLYPFNPDRENGPQFEWGRYEDFYWQDWV